MVPPWAATAGDIPVRPTPPTQPCLFSTEVVIFNVCPSMQPFNQKSSIPENAPQR